MTPCERLGYKVGDAFVAPTDFGKVKKGDIVCLSKDDGTSLPYFSLNKESLSLDACFSISNFLGECLAKPCQHQTEAERRGAKFGVGGVVKFTKEKCIFLGETKYEKGKWLIARKSNCAVVSADPDTIRLDHEPEYKEIPFAEATHEQRMNVENLVYNSERKVIEILHFQSNTYAYQLEGMNGVFCNESRLTVKVPA